jgi:hypothetical protein
MRPLVYSPPEGSFPLQAPLWLRVYGYGFQQCLGVGSKPTSIFHSERGQDVGASVRCRDEMARGDVRHKLSVLRLLRFLPRDGGYLLHGCIPMHCCYNRVVDHVYSLRKEVEGHYIAMHGAACRSESSCLHHHRRVRHPGVLQNRFDDPY